MIVLQKTSTLDDGFDYRNGLVITIDDKSVVRFYDWESEDNNLGRNFSDCYNIYYLMKEMYELWRKWVEVDFDTKEVSWDEI